MVGVIETLWLQLIGSLALTAIAVGIAWRSKALTASGARAAFMLGAALLFFGQPFWMIVLGAFFVSSSGWSKWKKKHRQKREAEANYAKSGSRDAVQVWANGGVALILCMIHYFVPSAAWTIWAFVGVMAAVNADTWATEIGALSAQTPRSLLSWRPVKTGTSGGVTPLGTFAAVMGSVFIGVVASLTLPEAQLWSTIAIATCSGTIGAFVDSLLGATVQAMYRCPVCGEVTERTVHCHTSATLHRGFRWMTNDVVNLTSSIIAAILAVILAYSS